MTSGRAANDAGSTVVHPIDRVHAAVAVAHTSADDASAGNGDWLVLHGALTVDSETTSVLLNLVVGK